MSANSPSTDDSPTLEGEAPLNERDTRPIQPTADDLDITIDDGQRGLPSVDVALGGPVPRPEPTHVRPRGADLYVRLEGKIYGPFQPERLEVLLESGTLTGLETASVDLHHWTPLAYHPRIVRGRIRDLEQVHEVLTEMSSLPVRKKNPQGTPAEAPGSAILRRPRRRRKD